MTPRILAFTVYRIIAMLLGLWAVYDNAQFFISSFTSVEYIPGWMQEEALFAQAYIPATILFFLAGPLSKLTSWKINDSN